MHILLLTEFWTNYPKTIGRYSSIFGVTHALQKSCWNIERIWAADVAKCGRYRCSM